MILLPYSEPALAQALSNTHTPPDLIEAKNHFLYLKDYLGPEGLNAATIIIEEEYISKDFIQDYAEYYSLCFEKYPKFCKRVHFFSSSFTEAEFKSALLDNTAALWNEYLGFIVVKPIPVTVIGITVLKTYKGNGDFNERNFWGIRNYKIHLYGAELTLSSLAFQEQDSVMSACATTAIWSMLNKAALDHHTVLKSPSQITKDAGSLSSDGSRLFPNSGLIVQQMCEAIHNSGLEPEVIDADYSVVNATTTHKFVSNRRIKKILNAYSPIGIPIILIINVPNGHEYGLHAITVSGYKQNTPGTITPNPAISYLANSIDKFYAHDDQWGPFARITFKGEYELITPWTTHHLKPNDFPTYTTHIVVPVYPKIRIPYQDIEVIVLGLDFILSFFFDEKVKSDLVWDIKIEYSENHKSHIKQSTLNDVEKLRHLEKSLPKYVWVATGYIGENKVLEFTFDATNVSNGMYGLDVISYLTDVEKSELKSYLEINKGFFQHRFKHVASAQYYEFLIEKL